MAFVYVGSHWENIITFRQNFKFYYCKLQIRLTLPNQNTIPFPNPARGCPKAFTLRSFNLWCQMTNLKKLPKFGKIIYQSTPVQFPEMIYTWFNGLVLLREFHVVIGLEVFNVSSEVMNWDRRMWHHTCRSNLQVKVCINCFMLVKVN